MHSGWHLSNCFPARTPSKCTLGGGRQGISSLGHSNLHIFTHRRYSSSPGPIEAGKVQKRKQSKQFTVCLQIFQASCCKSGPYVKSLIFAREALARTLLRCKKTRFGANAAKGRLVSLRLAGTRYDFSPEGAQVKPGPGASEKRRTYPRPSQGASEPGAGRSAEVEPGGAPKSLKCRG